MDNPEIKSEDDFFYDPRSSTSIDGPSIPIPLPSRMIPITQSESPTMNLNTDDANAVSRFFQSIADKVVLASTLPKEVEELRTAVESLKRDVEQYREHMARADEEISNLRRERQQLQDENANLRSQLESISVDYKLAEQRWNTACSERDKWHTDHDTVASALVDARRERDDAQMKIMELEDSVRALSSTIDNVVRERDNLDNRLSSIRSALA